MWWNWLLIGVVVWAVLALLVGLVLGRVVRARDRQRVDRSGIDSADASSPGAGDGDGRVA